MFGKCRATVVRAMWVMSRYTHLRPRRLISASMARATMSRGASSMRSS